MARASGEVLNDIRAIESEIEALESAEMQDEYADYYQQLFDDRDTLIVEYDEAVRREEEALMSDPPPVESPGQNQSYPEDHYDDDESSGGMCHELPVAGTGDPICLVDWGEIERQKLEELNKYFGGVRHVGLDPVRTPSYQLDSATVDSHTWKMQGVHKGKKVTLSLNRLKSNGKESGSPSSSFGTFDVSARISDALRKVIADVTERGGVLTSSGGLRPLSFPVNAARSATSFHYAGLAVDLFTLSGCLNPTAKLSDEARARLGREYVDQFVVQRDGETSRGGYLWRVWCRSNKPEHPDVKMGPIKACQFVDSRAADEKDTLQTGDPFHFRDDIDVTGPFFDLTEIFEKYDFDRISGRDPWTRSGGSQVLGALDSMEWWHFELTTHLTTSTRFGEALLEIHTPKEVVNSAPWRYRNALYTGHGSFK